MMAFDGLKRMPFDKNINIDARLGSGECACQLSGSVVDGVSRNYIHITGSRCFLEMICLGIAPLSHRSLQTALTRCS